MKMNGSRMRGNELPKPRRTTWTPERIAILIDYLKNHLKTGRAPSVAEHKELGELLELSELQVKNRITYLKNQWRRAVQLGDEDTEDLVTKRNAICPDFLAVNEYFSNQKDTEQFLHRTQDNLEFSMESPVEFDSNWQSQTEDSETISEDVIDEDTQTSYNKRRASHVGSGSTAAAGKKKRKTSGDFVADLSEKQMRMKRSFDMKLALKEREFEMQLSIQERQFEMEKELKDLDYQREKEMTERQFEMEKERKEREFEMDLQRIEATAKWEFEKLKEKRIIEQDE